MTSPAPDRAGLSPALRTLIALAAGTVVLAGLWFAQEIVGPLALAAVLVIICHPLRHPLERRGWPTWLATTVVVVVAYLVLAALAAMLVFAGIQFAALVAESTAALQGAVDDAVALLRTLGWDQQAAAALASLTDPARLIGTVTSFGTVTVAVATGLFLMVAYILFMAADAARYQRAETVFGPAIAPTIRRIAGFSRGVRRYYVVNASFGAVVAAIDGLALWALGVPGPLVWAILAFVTNFIPNIGFVLGLVPPAVMALVAGGWPLMLVVIGVYCLANVTLQVFIQPKFVADAVNLSLTLSFFSVVFWTFIVGPLGAILSIPLTLLVRALLWEGDPRGGWLRWLSGEMDAAPSGPPAAPDAVSPAAEPSRPRIRRR